MSIDLPVAGETPWDAKLNAAITGIDADLQAHKAAGGGGGSTILSGTATPTNAIGAVGDYYLDTDDRILYGPKQTPPVEGYVSPPTARNEAGQVNIGMKFRFSTAGYVTALRILLPSGTSGGGWNAYLFRSDNATALSSLTSPSLALGWNQIALPSPVPVVANQTYIVSVWLPNSSSACGIADATYAGQTSGGVVGLAEGFDGTAVVYNGGATGTLPATGWSNHSIGVSPVFIAGFTWPVALKSPPPGGTTGQVLKKLSGTDYDWGWGA